jgi:uncharacterized protein YodC (DUF2158 family)
MKIGDIVVLNSGGPDMTIIGVTGDKATVVWTSETNMIMRNTFPVVCLKYSI